MYYGTFHKKISNLIHKSFVSQKKFKSMFKIGAADGDIFSVVECLNILHRNFLGMCVATIFQSTDPCFIYFRQIAVLSGGTFNLRFYVARPTLLTRLQRCSKLSTLKFSSQSTCII